MRRSILALLLIFGTAATAMAQDTATAGGYVSDRWTTDNGLPQNSIQELIQSHDGYLWLATNGGVARFDGVTFTTLSSGMRKGLDSDRVLNLAEDDNGFVWAGTENGLSRYDGVNFRTWTVADGMPGAAISALSRNPDGGIVFGTSNGGLGIIKDSTLRVIMKPGGVLGDPISRIVIDHSNAVWIWSHTGIWLADLRNGSFKRMVAPRRAGETAPLGIDDKDGVWAATDTSVVHVTATRMVDYPIRHLLGNPSKMCRRGPGCGPWADFVDLTSIVSYDAHTLLLGTRAGEVWLFHPDSMNSPGAVRRIEKSDRGNTNVVMVDREKNIWVGTNLSGLVRVRPSLLQVYTTSDGLAADVTEAVFADRDGRIWAGGNCGGVAVQNGARFTALRYKDGLMHECVWSLAQDTAGAVWIGTYGGGVGRWRNGIIAWYTTRDGLPSDDVLSMYRDRDGTMWVGTMQGLVAWNGTRFQPIPIGPAHFTADVRTIVQAHDGSLWLGMTNGLAHYANGHAQIYTRKEGLPNDFVRAVYEDSKGVIWAGTYGGGLARLRDGKFTSFNVSDGLFDNFISSLVADEHDNFWMSSNRGIFRVSRAELNAYADGRSTRIQSIAYGKNDGMLSSETNGGFEPAVTRSPDGRLWYPTMMGLAVIDPARATTNTVPPTVVVEQVTVNGRDVPATAHITAGKGTTDLTFTYSGVSFVAPDAVTFRYRLDGWEQKWIEAGTRRFASYSRLPPGHYHFLVMAANRDGVWSKTATSIAVDVTPHVWQTWWFRVLLALALTALVVAVIRARLRMVQLEARDASRKQVTAILESITNAFVALDRNWRFTYVNHSAEELLHESRADLVGRNFWEVFPHGAGGQTELNLRQVMMERKPMVFDAPDRTAYGQWLGIHAYPAEEGISIYMTDITARRNAEEALRTQTLRDDLTGVFNRRGFLMHAERQSLVAHRSSKPFDIVFIDMDGMKHINDAFGHPAGDTALCDTVALLQHAFRETDVIGRLGGDEFAVLVSDSGEAGVALALERVQQRLDAYNAEESHAFDLSLSIGVSRYDPKNPTPVDALLEIADRRMYEEKRAKGAAR